MLDLKVKKIPHLLLLQLSLNSLTYLNLAGNVIKDEVSDEKIFGELQKNICAPVGELPAGPPRAAQRGVHPGPELHGHPRRAAVRRSRPWLRLASLAPQPRQESLPHQEIQR